LIFFVGLVKCLGVALKGQFFVAKREWKNES